MNYATRQLGAAFTRGQSSRSTGLTAEGAAAIGDALRVALDQRDARLQVLEDAAESNVRTVEALVSNAERLQRRQHELLADQDRSRERSRTMSSTRFGRTLLRAESVLDG